MSKTPNLQSNTRFKNHRNASALKMAKSYELYKQFYDKAGMHVNMLRQQSSDPILWPTATINDKTHDIQVIPGQEKVNFDAIEFLLSSKSKEHQLRTLLTRLSMGEYIEMGNRQQNFEDIIIDRVKQI